MTDRPILFSRPMVRALLDGRKTQTRRLATSPLARTVAGDRLYVREEFSGPYSMYEQGEPPRNWPAKSPIWCWADGQPVEGDWTPPKPGMHMPRWASRLTLPVIEMRLQPLHALTEADALAEGVYQRRPADKDGGRHFGVDGTDIDEFTAARAYRALWRSLHSKPGERWEDNPEIVALTFKVERRNIDAKEAS